MDITNDELYKQATSSEKALILHGAAVAQKRLDEHKTNTKNTLDALEKFERDKPWRYSDDPIGNLGELLRFLNLELKNNL